jgi:hypothetical protein
MLLTEVPELKHLILHAERFVLPDHAADYAEYICITQDAEGYVQDSERQYFINQLVRYTRMAELLCPLLKLGSVIFLPSSAEFRISDVYGKFKPGVPLRFYGSNFRENYMWQSPSLIEAFALDDPYIAWVVVNKLKPIEHWEYEVQGFRATDLEAAARYIAEQAEYYPHIEESLAKLEEVTYGGEARPGELADAVQLNYLCRQVYATPMVSSRLTQIHLSNSAAVVLDGNQAKLRKKGQVLETAVTYRVPSLAPVSLEDLMKLRLNEDIYYDVRKCLDSLALSVACPGAPTSYDAYEQEVRRQAEDIVRPVYENLNSRLRREKALSMIAGYGIGGLVGLGINGLAMLTHGASEVAVRSTKNTASSLGKKVGQRKFGRDQKDLSTACSILLSLFDG